MGNAYDNVRRRGVSAFVRETHRDVYWRALAEHRATYLGPDGRVCPESVESVACAVCGTSPEHTVFWKDGFSYVRCVDCGSLFVSPQLTQAEIERYWVDSPVAALWAEVLETPAQVAFDRAKFADALEWVERLRGGSPGSVLDIGCSTGVFLEVARERGWEGRGVEPGTDVRRQALSRGLDVVASTSDLDAAAYDLVTFWEVVEHTKRPLATLEEAVRRLAPDAIVLTLVGGNAHSFANRVMQASSAAFDFARLWYFHPRSYGRLLAQVGLHQLEYRSVLPELDTTLNYMRYGDPYDTGNDDEVLPRELLRELERAVLAGDLGYKFLSVARQGRRNTG